MNWRDAYAKIREIKRPKWWPWAVWIAILVPGIATIIGLVLDFTTGSRWLGSEPIKEGEQIFGQLTIKYLVATLAVTPVRRILGWNWTARDRRTFGLTAFFYGLAHLLWYVALDIQFDWADLQKDFTKRSYIIVGTLSLLVMLPLAITSTKKAIKEMGKKWTKLHNWTYLVPLLGMIHWAMSVKADYEEPIMFTATFAGLLGWRWWWSRRKTSGHAGTPPEASAAA